MIPSHALSGFLGQVFIKSLGYARETPASCSSRPERCTARDFSSTWTLAPGGFGRSPAVAVPASLLEHPSELCDYRQRPSMPERDPVDRVHSVNRTQSPRVG